MRIWSFVGGCDLGSRAAGRSKRRRLMVVRQRVVRDVGGRAWPLVRDVGDDWRGFMVFRDGLEGPGLVVVEVGGP